MIDLESTARAICEADHHNPWPTDDYNGRSQRRHYMKLAAAAHADFSKQLLSEQGMLDGTIAAVESDSAPFGTPLFDIHWREFAAGYANTLRAALVSLLSIRQ